MGPNTHDRHEKALSWKESDWEYIKSQGSLTKNADAKPQWPLYSPHAHNLEMSRPILKLWCSRLLCGRLYTNPPRFWHLPWFLPRFPKPLHPRPGLQVPAQRPPGLLRLQGGRGGGQGRLPGSVQHPDLQAPDQGHHQERGRSKRTQCLWELPTLLHLPLIPGEKMPNLTSFKFPVPRQPTHHCKPEQKWWTWSQRAATLRGTSTRPWWWTWTWLWPRLWPPWRRPGSITTPLLCSHQIMVALSAMEHLTGH